VRADAAKCYASVPGDLSHVSLAGLSKQDAWTNVQARNGNGNDPTSASMPTF
jgi:hypothetical protein